MRHRFDSMTGFVLAGGASRRMGRDKAKLLMGNETMLDRAIKQLQRVCRTVAVIGPPKNFGCADVLIYPDEQPGRGPLGGIFTGLLQTRTEYNLFAGCDLPFIDPQFLRYLSKRALTTSADVTVPESRTHTLQPLSAVYRRRALGAIRMTLATGENKVSRFFKRVHCEIVPWNEIARAGFLSCIFDNMNTPREYEAASKVLTASY
jgi:molybdopterin-guanine dinucleotide biosynthesis protein A